MNTPFRIWLEDDEEQDFNFWKDLILNYLGLDQKNGLSIPLNTMDLQNLQAKLQGLGEFARLSPDVQQRALGLLSRSNPGTMGDLIRAIASPAMRVA
jgi:hypothetical protein